MIVTAWNNGQHHSSGAGYGVKVNPMDRDKYFSHKWETILLKLEGEHGFVEVNTNKKSFWFGSCRELISKDIGQWLLRNDLAPWEKYNPPKLNLEPIKGNKFILRRP
jgi:hypothetical protein